MRQARFSWRIMAIIEFEGVSFSYDGTHNALDNIDLRIEQGEFACILGGNGSGKSTLAKHVNALLVPDSGTVNVLGLRTDEVANTYAVRSNAGMIFQNPDDQIVASLVEDDVAFGPENLGVPPDELATRVSSALEQVGLRGFEKSETSALSGGQKQRVAIAGVLAMMPQLIVFDEASAMLDPRGRKGLIRLCKQLNSEGITIVLITHFMEEAAQTDRVIVLDSGHVALDGSPHDVLTQSEALADLNLDIPFPVSMSHALQARGADITVALTVRELVGLLQDALPADAVPQDALPQDALPACAHPAKSAKTHDNAKTDAPSVALQPASTHITERDSRDHVGQADDALIRFSDVSFSYRLQTGKKRQQDYQRNWGNAPDDPWALKDVSLDINVGDFFGIAGHTGSGKSTLIQLTNGLLTPSKGRVSVQGIDLSDKRAVVQARRNVGVVFQYPERQLFAATVFDDVAFGPRNLGLDDTEVERRVKEALELVHLRPDDICQKSPFMLSGGQQRRVALAGVLAMQPTTLILDEPTAGLDPKARSSLLRLIQEFYADKGMTVVMVSHNMDDLARLCNRVLVLNQGRVFAVGSPASVFADEQALKSIGLGVPSTLHLANALNMTCPDNHIPTIDELADSILMNRTP